MIKFFLLAGLPSAGKTYLAKLLQQKLGGYLIDDPKHIEDIQIPEGTEIAFVTDPYFCLATIRKKSEQILQQKFGSCDIKWIFIELDPDQCRKNVLARNDGRKVEGSIRRFSAEGSYPAGAKIYPCYSEHTDYQKLAEDIINGLS